MAWQARGGPDATQHHQVDPRRCGGAGLPTLACSDDGLSLAADGSGTGLPLTGGSTTAEGGDTGPKLDVLANGTMGAEDGMGQQGCRRVDVVLVVDDSGRTSEEHEALQGPVFDSFLQTLLSIEGSVDEACQEFVPQG